MGAIASQITSLTSVYSIVNLDSDQRKHQNSASLAFVRGIHRGPVNSSHKRPVTRKMFQFDDVIMFAQHDIEASQLFNRKDCSTIIAASYGHQSILTHLPMYSLFSCLHWLTSKEVSKLRITGPLWKESTGDWRIPFSKGQWYEGCFHFKTSSWKSKIYLFMSQHKQITHCKS